jgi:ABC-type Zn uptake system ZnuABC Zn-binding protein ZnuA
MTMKQLILAFIAVFTALSSGAHARAAINVITSTEDLAALVREIGGD